MEENQKMFFWRNMFVIAMTLLAVADGATNKLYIPPNFTNRTMNGMKEVFLLRDVVKFVSFVTATGDSSSIWGLRVAIISGGNGDRCGCLSLTEPEFFDTTKYQYFATESSCSREIGGHGIIEYAYHDATHWVQDDIDAVLTSM